MNNPNVVLYNGLKVVTKKDYLNSQKKKNEQWKANEIVSRIKGKKPF